MKFKQYLNESNDMDLEWLDQRLDKILSDVALMVNSDFDNKEQALAWFKKTIYYKRLKKAISTAIKNAYNEGHNSGIESGRRSEMGTGGRMGYGGE